MQRKHVPSKNSGLEENWGKRRIRRNLGWCSKCRIDRPAFVQRFPLRFYLTTGRTLSKSAVWHRWCAHRITGNAEKQTPNTLKPWGELTGLSASLQCDQRKRTFDSALNVSSANAEKITSFVVPLISFGMNWGGRNAATGRRSLRTIAVKRFTETSEWLKRNTGAHC